MQQESTPFILGEAAVLRDQDEIRLQIDDAFKRSNPPDLMPRSPAALVRPTLASKELVRLSRPETHPRRDTAARDRASAPPLDGHARSQRQAG